MWRLTLAHGVVEDDIDVVSVEDALRRHAGEYVCLCCHESVVPQPDGYRTPAHFQHLLSNTHCPLASGDKVVPTVLRVVDVSEIESAEDREVFEQLLRSLSGGEVR
jgi:hypothetical protein